MSRSTVSTRTEPRISANDLARYMVSSETGKIGIVRASKYPTPPPMIRYGEARRTICTFLSDDGRGLNPLVAAEQAFEQRIEDPALSPLRKDDARQSIEVLHAIQRMANHLAQYRFRPAPTDQTKLMIKGVEVSVKADLIVVGKVRRIDHAGFAILRMTQDDATTDAARQKRQEMGRCVATLAQRHLEANFTLELPPANSLCLSIDVRHGEVFAAPPSNTRRMNNIESACQMIAALWPQI